MANPFSDTNRSQPLDGNPFDDVSEPNPFGAHANASSYTIDSETTPPATKYGYGGGGSGLGTSSASAFELDPERNQLEQERAKLRAEQDQVRRDRADLDARTRDLDRTEAKPNWPFFFPLVRHHIPDLPDVNQPTIRGIYFVWLGLIITLIVNLVACILLLIAGSSDGGKDTAAAGSYVGVITLASFFTWYRPIYLGFAKENGLALFFYLYFFFGGWHLLFSIYMFIGIPSTGSGGLINTISMLSQGHIVAGVFCVIATVGWAGQAVVGGYFYKRVWDFKNNHEGLSFQNATDQFKRESFKTVVLHQSRM